MSNLTATASSEIRCTPALAALAYAVAGWPVLPIHTPTPDGGCSCSQRVCRNPGKHPRTKRGLLQATTDPTTIAAWWKRWPDANVGVRTGQLIVVDVDGHDGAQSLAALEAAHGDLPPTRRVRTAKGEHIYFLADDHVISCSAGQLGKGLDIRGRGGYIIAPPSQHVTGHRYAWSDLHDLTSLPEWLTKLLPDPKDAPTRRPLPRTVAVRAGDRARRYMQAALDGELQNIARAPIGTRNMTLNRAAFRLGQLVGAGFGEFEEIAQALHVAALSSGLTEGEAGSTIRSGLGAGKAQARNGLPEVGGDTRPVGP
ncbi:bifunctional DNA primase/polymerase-like protein [Solirubrobacter pauli]|uniref:Bifunctional DNA primase/polymerase-like protein n=1 Tax=Solirubrobacter pauli TaxID=166793 RepID=A0A660LIL8_9ACTN|nr:bifunctional DNA primase/polymerase [Solirubrobacter pauli]RKQ92974.1 bifunctional DNA primase/polymerase-like protein [Solirubrobacter pauli]